MPSLPRPEGADHMSKATNGWPKRPVSSRERQRQLSRGDCDGRSPCIHGANRRREVSWPCGLRARSLEFPVSRPLEGSGSGRGARAASSRTERGVHRRWAAFSGRKLSPRRPPAPGRGPETQHENKWRETEFVSFFIFLSLYTLRLGERGLKAHADLAVTRIFHFLLYCGASVCLVSCSQATSSQ